MGSRDGRAAPPRPLPRGRPGPPLLALAALLSLALLATSGPAAEARPGPFGVRAEAAARRRALAQAAQAAPPAIIYNAGALGAGVQDVSIAAAVDLRGTVGPGELVLHAVIGAFGSLSFKLPAFNAAQYAALSWMATAPLPTTIVVRKRIPQGASI